MSNEEEPTREITKAISEPPRAAGRRELKRAAEYLGRMRTEADFRQAVDDLNSVLGGGMVSIAKPWQVKAATKLAEDAYNIFLQEDELAITVPIRRLNIRRQDRIKPLRLIRDYRTDDTNTEEP